MIPLVLSGALVPLLVQQDPAAITVQRGSDPPRVSANREAITVSLALEELGRALGWTVIWEAERVKEDLASESVDLSFRDQDPRVIAQLIALSGGADVAFEDADSRPVLHVISPPDPGTEAGRQRLRRRAVQWYRTFLADELRADPLVIQNKMRVRMQIAQLLIALEDLKGAIPHLEQIYTEDRTHDFVPTALLQMAEAYYALGDFESAEQWARELQRSHRSLPEASAATALLGRALLAQERYEACREAMREGRLQISDPEEIIDLYLLAAEAEMRLGRPRDAYDHMKTLSVARSFRESSSRQFLDFHFLYAYGALGTGRFEDAMKALERFLGVCQEDPRKGEAFTMLGNAYLALDKYLEARAAAIEARNLMEGMSEEARTEARKLWARTSLAVGDKEAAFQEMELEVRRTLDPDSILFLIDEFMNERRFQRAISTADLLIDQDTEAGDRARYLKVLSMWKQAEQTGVIGDFPSRAVGLVKMIRDKELQSRVSEILGRAYERTGDLERASEAYRGILR